MSDANLATGALRGSGSSLTPANAAYAAKNAALQGADMPARDKTLAESVSYDLGNLIDRFSSIAYRQNELLSRAYGPSNPVNGKTEEKEPYGQISQITSQIGKLFDLAEYMAAQQQRIEGII